MKFKRSKNIVDTLKIGKNNYCSASPDKTHHYGTYHSIETGLREQNKYCTYCRRDNNKYKWTLSDLKI